MLNYWSNCERDDLDTRWVPEFTKCLAAVRVKCYPARADLAETAVGGSRNADSAKCWTELKPTQSKITAAGIVEDMINNGRAADCVMISNANCMNARRGES